MEQAVRHLLISSTYGKRRKEKGVKRRGEKRRVVCTVGGTA
jgi:hypothetical protein